MGYSKGIERLKRMKKINTTPPSGTRDFLPEDVRFREALFRSAKTVFETYGFLPLETPAFERLEILSGKYGEEGEKLMYKILKRGDQEKTGEPDLALRYDLTIPLARVVAEYAGKLPRIFKRYQIVPVWRADRPGKGRYRELVQCDIDTVGTDYIAADAEIILAIADAISAMGIQQFEIRLNSRKVLTGLLDAYGVQAAKQNDVLIVLDKLGKNSLEEIKQELKNKQVAQTVIDELMADLGTKDAEDVVRKKVASNETGRVGLQEVDEILKLTEPFVEKASIVFRPFLARGLDYYTGPIFEFFSPDLRSSIAGGGRYDNLIGMFAKKTIPACGCSIGIERIADIVTNKKERNERPIVNVLTLVWNKNFMSDALQLATELRRTGIATDLYLENATVSKQFEYAGKQNYEFALLVGPKEKESDAVSIKNLKTAKQETVPINQIATYLRKHLP